MSQSLSADITYQISPPLDNEQLNVLFAAAWADHRWRDLTPVLARSLAWVCACASDTLVGFVNLAWDGGVHAFLLDTTVHPAWQRRGIGQHLVSLAAQEAQRGGAEWLHVDYEPHLEPFYSACGFQHSLAGVMRLLE
jgi:GNAT superfamily N-acetyltransferase